ncbi:nucleotidyltransferase family protein [Serratia ureilytica]
MSLPPPDAGERFIQAGGRGNKLNAGFADAAGERRSLFEHTCAAPASGLPVQVVTRPDNLPVLAACAANRCRSPCSPARASVLDRRGRCGHAALAGLADSLADMPFVGADVFPAGGGCLTAARDRAPLCATARSSGRLFRLIAQTPCQLRGDNGARELLQGAAVHLLPLEQPGVVQDIDLPSQLPASE